LNEYQSLNDGLPAWYAKGQEADRKMQWTTKEGGLRTVVVGVPNGELRAAGVSAHNLHAHHRNVNQMKQQRADLVG
jgi:hypothetical protein